jgi:glycosyltransferase involved in cell wall biosynthesis
MADPLLSIVTPSYNQGKFIEENILSVKRQAAKFEPGVEHIIVDGGSTDSTVEIIKKHEKDYNIRWVSEPDRGQSHAINKGIEMADGKWIGWQNSDDYYLSGAFEILNETIQKASNPDLVYGDVLVVNKDSEEINRIFTIPPSKFVHRNWSLFTSNQSTFIKKSVFKKIGNIDEDLDYAMDADLFSRILETNFKLIHVPEFLGVFRSQPEAKTAQSVDDKIKSESNRIYKSPTHEKYLPKYLRKNAAKILKGIYLFRIRRWDAFKYNLLRQ